ncbi:uncharacterized protein LOC129364636 isoform X2 [Poeciliopsis prolifica]|uniref:uncharacterized protein LOC129364636 isoform X2 n=1 Tax=Poeciliopsis prolifica TaxID=188132 RepID=UPI002412FAE0|nr:uncharacterized protein LOC129364636 isoform X2 [Poeciliopsis prolifica]
MCKTERQKALAAYFDPEKMRKKNNRALQKLLKINEELENDSDRRARFRNRFRLEKEEKVFFEEAEKRLLMLNSQSDIWADEEEKLDSLCKKRDMLFGILKDTSDQLLEESVMKSMIRAANQQHERLNYLHKVLKKNIRTLTKQLVNQTKVFDEYTEKGVETREMMMIQDCYFKELRKKLRVFNVSSVKKKVTAEEERVKEAVDKNHRLEEMIKTLKHQAINVPILKYQFQCAVDEERRLKDLNIELDKVIQILTQKLADQTRWETTYQDVERRVNNIKEINHYHLKKFEELTGRNLSVGSESMLSLFTQDRSKKQNLAKRLHTFKSKIHNLQKEYKSFQPEIVMFLGDLTPYCAAENSETPSIPPAVAYALTGQTYEHRKPEKFSDESSSDIDNELSDSTDDSSDIFSPKSSHAVRRFTKILENRAFISQESENESTKSRGQWWKEWWRYFF